MRVHLRLAAGFLCCHLREDVYIYKHSSIFFAMERGALHVLDMGTLFSQGLFMFFDDKAYDLGMKMNSEAVQARLLRTFGAKHELSDISCCVRRTIYPNGLVVELACDRPLFREKGWEDADKWSASPRTEVPGEADHNANIARAMRRAKSLIRDLALSNDMKYFVTMTIDGEKMDRRDPAALVSQINRFCKNRVHRHGLAYIFVPERHKDGSFHMHGFVNSAVRVVDSGTVVPPEGGKPKRPRSARQRAEWLESGGHVVFNIPDWDVGFTTAVELYGDYMRAVDYVCKYVGKQLGDDGFPQKIGGRWVYHGGCHERPTIEVADIPFDDVQITDTSWAWWCEELGCTFIRTVYSL